MKLRDEIRIRIKIKIYLQHHAKKSRTGSGCRILAGQDQVVEY